jgi:hypothetical protein
MYVPPKTAVLIFPFLTQRNPALWDEDSEEFIPERWIDPARLKKFADNPSKFIPFSLGPRTVSLELPFRGLRLYLVLTNLGGTVYRAELLVERSFLFHDTVVTAIRQIHASGGSAIDSTLDQRSRFIA